MKSTLRVPLSCPLPASDSRVNPETGLWYHVEWTKETLAAARANHFKTITVKEKKS